MLASDDGRIYAGILRRAMRATFAAAGLVVSVKPARLQRVAALAEWTTHEKEQPRGLP
jgi:hypothetical protein